MYSTALVVLTLPIGFVVSAFLISRLVLSRAIAFGLKKDAVAKTVQDILIKSYVWFSLFSFPILSSR